MADKIQIKDGKLIVPDQPIIPFIEGDGIGPDIWAASQRVIDAANRRMAEVHAKKAEEANAAFKAIEAASNERKATEAAARKKELDAVNKIRSTHASNVVA